MMQIQLVASFERAVWDGAQRTPKCCSRISAGEGPADPSTVLMLLAISW